MNATYVAVAALIVIGCALIWRIRANEAAARRAEQEQLWLKSRSEGTVSEMEQIEILQRVAAGETAFYAPRATDSENAAFNELVEHIVALSRRGMLKCDAPTVNLKNSGEYTSIDNIMLTPAGRHWLETRR